jgi:hypothetical protein
VLLGLFAGLVFGVVATLVGLTAYAAWRARQRPAS